MEIGRGLLEGAKSDAERLMYRLHFLFETIKPVDGNSVAEANTSRSLVPLMPLTVVPLHPLSSLLLHLTHPF